MSENFGLISQKAKSYVALYDKLIQPARPRWTDDLLSALWLDRVARNRRLTRIRKISGQVSEYRGRAVETLKELLEVATELKRSAEATNAMSIGRMSRLESDVELETVKVEALRTSCADTVGLIEARIGAPLPEDWSEWPAIATPFDEVNPMSERVRHQRQWSAIIETVTKVAGLREELRKADQSFQRSSVIEQRATGYLERLQTENRLIDRRFDELEADIRIGELEEILATLDGKSGDQPALADIERFEDLAPLEVDAEPSAQPS